MDKKDKKIVEILLKDGRKSYVEIGKMLNLCEGSIRRRIRKLQDEGIIVGYSAQIDPKKLGYNIISLTGIDTEPEYFLDVLSELKKLDVIKRLYTTTGDHMLMAEIWSKSSEEFSNLIFNKIGKIKGVRKICPSIILDQVK
jgi:Lrp/AsnC family transcriptional regulator for asnA, asnC and gidA